MIGTTSLVLAARVLALDEAAVATMAILEAAGIDVLLIKGPVSAARLYPEAPDARNYCDVDLLVAPHQFAYAQATLARSGYVSASVGMRPSELDEREVTWWCPGDTRLAIDLHRSLAWVGDPSALWSTLWRDRTSMKLQGTDVQIPDTAGSALIVGLHASRAGSTRKPFRDLARAVAVFDGDQWRQAIETARKCDALTGLALGLDTVPESRPLLARFDLPTAAPAAMRMHSYGTSSAGVSFERLLEARGRRTRHFADRALPSVAHMHKVWPASKSGRSALVRAHGARWARFAKGVPRGLIQLRQAHQGGPAGRDSWTFDALVSVRRQLAETGMEQVDPFRSPGRAITERSVEIILQRNSASCLERSLVRQRYYLAKGQNRDVIVGVSPPKDGFRAHAWVSGDAEEGNELYQTIHRSHANVTMAAASRSRLALLRYRIKQDDHRSRGNTDHD